MPKLNFVDQVVVGAAFWGFDDHLSPNLKCWFFDWEFLAVLGQNPIQLEGEMITETEFWVV